MPQSQEWRQVQYRLRIFLRLAKHWLELLPVLRFCLTPWSRTSMLTSDSLGGDNTKSHHRHLSNTTNVWEWNVPEHLMAVFWRLEPVGLWGQGLGFLSGFQLTLAQPMWPMWSESQENKKTGLAFWTKVAVAAVVLSTPHAEQLKKRQSFSKPQTLVTAATSDDLVLATSWLPEPPRRHNRPILGLQVQLHNYQVCYSKKKKCQVQSLTTNRTNWETGAHGLQAPDLQTRTRALNFQAGSVQSIKQIFLRPVPCKAEPWLICSGTWWDPCREIIANKVQIQNSKCFQCTPLSFKKFFDVLGCTTKNLDLVLFTFIRHLHPSNQLPELPQCGQEFENFIVATSSQPKQKHATAISCYICISEGQASLKTRNSTQQARSRPLPTVVRLVYTTYYNPYSKLCSSPVAILHLLNQFCSKIAKQEISNPHPDRSWSRGWTSTPETERPYLDYMSWHVVDFQLPTTLPGIMLCRQNLLK